MPPSTRWRFLSPSKCGVDEIYRRKNCDALPMDVGLQQNRCLWRPYLAGLSRLLFSVYFFYLFFAGVLGFIDTTIDRLCRHLLTYPYHFAILLFTISPIQYNSSSIYSNLVEVAGPPSISETCAWCARLLRINAIVTTEPYVLPRRSNQTALPRELRMAMDRRTKGIVSSNTQLFCTSVPNTRLDRSIVSS